MKATRLTVATGIALVLASLTFAHWPTQSRPHGPEVGPLTSPGLVRAAALSNPARRHVVRQGDTLWSIARSLQPEGDLRPLVDRLALRRGSRPLQVGEVVVVPVR